MHRIALIVAYFGVLPSFYKAWEKTAMANSSIDFYVFTDDDSLNSHNNILVQKMSFVNFREKIQEKFDFEISLKHPYKLCDYKPTYGLVFEKMLKNYDWWGYCDIDLLLGDLRKFFTDSVLSRYDRCQLLGHLCLYRNNEKMNTLFKVQEGPYPALNYETVYRTEDSMYFDEARGMLTKGLISRISNYCEESFRDPLEGERKFYFKHKNPQNNFVIIWENGHLCSVEKNGKRTELLYAHFFRRQFRVEECPDQIQKIKIIPTQVVYNSDITIADFDFREVPLYKGLYTLRNIYKSIKRYGIRKTIKRQKWSRDHSRYIQDLRNELQKPQ